MLSGIPGRSKRPDPQTLASRYRTADIIRQTYRPSGSRTPCPEPAMPTPIELTPSPRFTPTARDLLMIAALALIVRVIIVLAAARVMHQPVREFSTWGDAPSYIAQAYSMRGDNSHMTDFDRRTFPGYAVLIAVVSKFGV